ncbi:DsbA family oxidoreductase [Rhodocista pekingensis]|uniref:DsbA family oxidoreductase n=1 Tax=Rhodocista pekingensis TaxID=201185 RepID=A0ABW2KSN1_9PROT
MLIEIFSDLICPWCYLGWHRLDLALAQRPGLRAETRWLPFQLNPDMPAGGMDRFFYLAHRFGSLERARQLFAAVEQAAAQDGLPLHLGRIRRTPSTLEAHALVLLAERYGRAVQVAKALFRAYFVDGMDIGNRGVLIAVAGACGLDRTAVARHLETGEDAATVRASDARARSLGIQAVPCFIFNRQYGLAGAQEPAALLPLLDLAGVDADPAASSPAATGGLETDIQEAGESETEGRRTDRALGLTG